MSYFSNFPDIYYQFTIGNTQELKVIKDIVRNVRPIQDVLKNVTFFESYVIQDGDTAEIISERVYGTPYYHWVILLINEMYSHTEDWPIPNYLFDTFVTKKYGVGHEYDIHQLYGRDHYVSTEGHVVDSNYALAIPVTNYDYEQKINDTKRQIRLVSPQIIDTFTQDLEVAFNG
jgi:Base plate wedge protein 53